MKKKSNQLLIDVLVCPDCKTKLSKQGSKLICTKKHIFNMKDSVPILAELDPYLVNEAHAWEDNWKKGVSKGALKSYEKSMNVFKKLGFWEEAGDAANLIPSKSDYTVLDLACGNGVSTAHIKGKLVIGLDLSETQLAKAKKKYENNYFVVGDARKLPFANDSFDLVVGINMLHHVPDPDVVLKECYRILKPGGKVLTVDPNLYNPIGFTGRGLFKLLKLKKLFPTIPQFALGDDEYQFTKTAYYKLFEDSPFKQFKIIPHRIERIFFFGSVLVPAVTKIPGYFSILYGVSKFGNMLVKIPPFDWICYFWIGEATKGLKK